MPLSTTSHFDVQRYMGQWHQVAATPAWFQSDCFFGTKANYALMANGQVKVLNTCETANKRHKQAEGRARFLTDRTDGRLEVTFLQMLGFWMWPVAGDYWIVALDQDYQWSVVGQPSRKYAWVLGRSATLDPAALREIRVILERESYDTCKLMMTTPKQSGRLCDVAR